MEFIGWIGGLLLAFCAAPQAIKTMHTKKANDISWLFLLMWGFGEICAAVYITENTPLFFNYIVNIIFIAIICFYKLKYGGKHEASNK